MKQRSWYILIIIVAFCYTLYYAYYSEYSERVIQIFANNGNNLHFLDNNLFWKNKSFHAESYVYDFLFPYLKHKGYEYDVEHKNISEKCRAIILNKNISTKLYRSQIWSQAYQDLFIFHQFFYGKQDGIYVDVGANYPFLCSNTAFFDLCMGWKGICVEPSKLSQIFKPLRSCTMAKKCGWSATKNNLKMKFKGGFTSIITDRQYQLFVDRNDTQNLFECDTISAFDLFNQYSARNRFDEITDLKYNGSDIIDIDLISLDIEGAEEEFLKCFPFNKYNVKVWTIEIDKVDAEKKIDTILYRYGYTKFNYIPLFTQDLDAIYIKQKRLNTPFENEGVYPSAVPQCDST